jgi:hypothetical protein
MANIFHKRSNSRRSRDNRPSREREHPRKVSDHDLVDPIAYVGDLDLVKFPILEQKKNTETQEFEPENPLNKR